MPDVAMLWKVWLGNYTEPVVVVCLPESTTAEIVRTARLGMHEKFQTHVRPEFEEHDREFWTDRVADTKVRKMEALEAGWLVPTLVAAPSATAEPYPSTDNPRRDNDER
jgi:hypothetical protein